MPRTAQLKNSRKSSEAAAFAVDLCQYALKIGAIRSATGGLTEVYRRLKEMPADSIPYKENAPRTLKLLAQLRRREGDKVAAEAFDRERQSLMEKLKIEE